MRKSSTGDLNLLDKGTRPAMIVSMVSIKLTMRRYQAAKANGFAERWMRTIREECLDHILILNETHLRNVLREYVDEHYNPARPHQGIGQSMPFPRGQRVRSGAVQKRQVLGGIIHDYYRAAV